MGSTLLSVYDFLNNRKTLMRKYLCEIAVCNAFGITKCRFIDRLTIVLAKRDLRIILATYEFICGSMIWGTINSSNDPLSGIGILADKRREGHNHPNLSSVNCGSKVICNE